MPLCGPYILSLDRARERSTTDPPYDSGPRRPARRGPGRSRLTPPPNPEEGRDRAPRSHHALERSRITRLMESGHVTRAGPLAPAGPASPMPHHPGGGTALRASSGPVLMPTAHGNDPQSIRFMDLGHAVGGLLYGPSGPVPYPPKERDRLAFLTGCLTCSARALMRHARLPHHLPA